MNPYNPNELSHSGIPKQKWGVRRWQNPDGSLTPAGRERYRKLAQKRRKLQAKMDKLEPQNGEKSEGTTQKKQGLTNDELRERTERARLEREYYDAQSAMEASYSRLHPAKVSKGKEFVKKHGTALADKLASTAINIAGDYALKKGKQWLGISEPKKKSDIVNDLQNQHIIRRYNEYEKQVASLEKTRTAANSKIVDIEIEKLRNKQSAIFNKGGGKKEN